MADVIQSAITSDTGADQLTRLAALVGQAPSETVDTLLATSDLKELAERLIAAWYTGMSGAKETRRVLSHDEALAWRATGYANAPGTCGVFGEWTAKPGSIATPSATAQGDKR